jgi:hypothetical protein
MNTTIEKPVSVSKPAAFLHHELSQLDVAFERVNLARIAAKDANDSFVALLPVATEAHMGVLLKCAEDGTAITDGYQPGSFVRLTAEQTKRLEDVRSERKKWLAQPENRQVIIDEVTADGGDLTAYTIRVGAQRTTRKLVFTQTHGTKPENKKKAGNRVMDAYEAITKAATVAALEGTES